MSSFRNLPAAAGAGRLFRVAGAAAVAGALALAACDDPTHPGARLTPPRPAGHVAQESFTCTVIMATQKLSCAATPTAGSTAPGVRAALIIGGQDIYLKLTSTGTAYDAGTEIFSTNVTVQNLMQTLIGTGDGTTVDGVSVFLVSDPSVVSGTGSVTVANADGVGVFTGSNQPYFQYSEILEPYQISAVRPWRFSVPSTVDSFQFVVYISAPMVDSNVVLVDAVWRGLANDQWSTVANWQNGVAPDDSSVVAIPRASLTPGGANPMLFANDTISDLRVGEGALMILNGYRLDVTRNVDALGAVTGGTLHLSGASALVGGTFSALEISGGARLQRPTTTTGAVSITGSLSAQGMPLTIALP